MRTYKKWNESTVQLTLPPSTQSQWGWDELLTVIDAILLPYIHICIWTIEQSLGVVSIHHMHNIGSSMCNLIEVDKLFLLLILKCIHMLCDLCYSHSWSFFNVVCNSSTSGKVVEPSTQEKSKCQGAMARNEWPTINDQGQVCWWGLNGGG